MTQTTSNGIRYPESTDDTRLWEHFKDIADDVDPQLAAMTVQYFTSSGTWNKPSNLKSAFVICVGGGGAGGGSEACNAGQCSAGSGGSSGATYVATLAASGLGSSETITVGGGGEGHSGGADADGSPGGDSSFGTHVVAPGGNGGDGGANSSDDFCGPGTLGPFGGTGVGDHGFRGGKGGAKYRLPTINTCQGGYGGRSMFGEGGEHTGNENNGADGHLYGGGGSGASTRQNNPTHEGGDGADGIVIVVEYY